MLHAQQDCEKNTTVEESGLLPSQNEGENQNPVHKPIVLEVNVIDDEETRGQQDGKAGHMRSLLVGQRNGLDEPISNQSQYVSHCRSIKMICHTD